LSSLILLLITHSGALHSRGIKIPWLKKITLDEETYNKLRAVKEALNCRTWKDLADRLYEMYVKKSE